MGNIANGSRWDSTTTTDSRSQRNRAGRRGGQLLTRARSSTYMNGLPTRSSPRCSCRGWSNHTPSYAVRRGRAPVPIMPVTNAIESINAQLRKIIKTRGHFPSDEAATKLLWLALRNITGKWGAAQHTTGRLP
ncbi:putative transposase, IS256 family [Cupriavidus taiwanensis]|uniref:Putative transposase, IS256 family n=1 Tax=Cupriavidus taiwanensis TaxID=164546 RepID=A0A375JFJ4_9BURK|nr:putative transposase, IS256 family [Cupriavidus taiwanensis]